MAPVVVRLHIKGTPYLSFLGDLCHLYRQLKIKYGVPLIPAKRRRKRGAKGDSPNSLDRRATARCRCGNLYLPLFDDGRDLFPHHPPHVEKVLSLGAGHEILHQSARVLPPHPDQLGPELTPVRRLDALPPENFD